MFQNSPILVNATSTHKFQGQKLASDVHQMAPHDTKQIIEKMNPTYFPARTLSVFCQNWDLGLLGEVGGFRDELEFPQT